MTITAPALCPHQLLTLLSSALLLLAWEDRSPRLDQVGGWEARRARRGERSVEVLTSMVMVTQLRAVRQRVTVSPAARSVVIQHWPVESDQQPLAGHWQVSMQMLAQSYPPLQLRSVQPNYPCVTDCTALSFLSFFRKILDALKLKRTKIYNVSPFYILSHYTIERFRRYFLYETFWQGRIRSAYDWFHVLVLILPILYRYWILYCSKFHIFPKKIY